MDADALTSLGVVAMLIAWVLVVGVGRRHAR
jgi:hypothetical protein